MKRRKRQKKKNGFGVHAVKKMMILNAVRSWFRLSSEIKICQDFIISKSLFRKPLADLFASCDSKEKLLSAGPRLRSIHPAQRNQLLLQGLRST